MYRAWIEEVLGLKIRHGQMRINPVISAAWSGFNMTYRHGEAVYAIQVENPSGCVSGVAWVEMNGRRLSDGVIPLTKELVKHQIIVRMGTPEAEERK
jgi:cyclic beta-1,2-glucan synthetase